VFKVNRQITNNKHSPLPVEAVLAPSHIFFSVLPVPVAELCWYRTVWSCYEQEWDIQPEKLSPFYSELSHMNSTTLFTVKKNKNKQKNAPNSKQNQNSRKTPLNFVS